MRLRCSLRAESRSLISVLFLALLVVSAVAGNVELPVATQGTEQWAGVVAKAMTVDGRSQSESLQALESFQALVTQKMGTTAASLMKLRGGDVSRVIADAMTHVVSIYAPTFFSSNTNLFQENIAALQFGFAGISVAPCAIPITPIGIGIFPAGIAIQPTGVSIAPTGVNILPVGANIAPTLMVIGPYDTTVAGQGLNIAPALIVVAPTKTVVNPVGPLAISDTLISATVPALP